MDSKKLNDWLQVAGLFGVLGGLVFVGLQLSLDRQWAAVEGTNQGTQNRQNWAELVNTNAEVWTKGLGGEPLSATESVRFDVLALAHEIMYFNNYTRSVRGISTQLPERWVREYAHEIHGNSGLEQWWADYRQDAEQLREGLGLASSTWNDAVMEELRRLDQLGSH
jgi:hypothetical protein